ncbi:MAG TPA: hypothetical protein VHF22_05730 [Planctomycetota bacterium]|nr:hypothetical protein [Planctomycetota bacterium]
MSGRVPSAPRPNRPVSAQAILAQAVALRAQIADVLARAAAGPESSPVEPPTRESLLRKAIALYMKGEETLEKAAELEESKQQLELLAAANALLRAYEETRDRYDAAITAAARHMLLRQLTELKKEVAHALARVRLIPGVIEA